MVDIERKEQFKSFVISQGHLDRINDYEPRVDSVDELMRSLMILCEDYASRNQNNNVPVAFAWYREGNAINPNHIEHINDKGEAVYIEFRMSTPPANRGWIPLYTSSPPDTANVLEMAANIAEDYAGNLLFTDFKKKYGTVNLVDAIRNLIKPESEGK